jgi:hypothetical protein
LRVHPARCCERRFCNRRCTLRRVRHPAFGARQVVFCGIMLFQESVSAVQAVGYSISLFFFVLYNYLQLKDAGHCG